MSKLDFSYHFLVYRSLQFKKKSVEFSESDQQNTWVDESSGDISDESWGLFRSVYLYFIAFQLDSHASGLKEGGGGGGGIQ